MHVVTLQEGTWSSREQGAADVGLTPDATLAWVRAGGASSTELAALGASMGLHPLALEDVQNARQRPKVEEYDGVTFAVVRVPTYAGGDVSWRQVGVFLGADWVVTASEALLPELDAVERRLLEKGLPEGRATACFVFYRILDALVDAWFPYVDAVEEHLEGLEDAALEDPNQALLASIRDVKRTVSKTRKVSGPMREATLSVERGDHGAIRDATRVYLRDVSDHMVRITERLEHVREASLIAQDAWNATLANRQNEIMKRLTVIAALLLLPGLLAGLGGMNFPGIPAWDYWTVTTSIVGVVAVGLAVAWRKDWL